jgi:hypothetical protein
MKHYALIPSKKIDTLCKDMALHGGVPTKQLRFKINSYQEATGDSGEAIPKTMDPYVLVQYDQGSVLERKIKDLNSLLSTKRVKFFSGENASSDIQNFLNNALERPLQ